ncbi:MAG TPA: helix-turn-helix transcriptional regulator [Amnibacterium sp.]|jgi:DNA-binding CsgD family transcriptional regulator|uniref:helix-turn-helix transcriptional regulator n=1 Tax=Amnibacterium sp. TaxID=1872496 RepID=UPI002F9517E8
MPTIAERTDARTDAPPLDPDDLWGVLAAVLALHSAADPRAFPDVVATTCERLLPADHVDLHDLRAAWADRSAHDGESPEAAASSGAAVLPVRVSPDGHRVALTASASRRSFWIVLERYADPFDRRDRCVAESLQAHLGPAFDHARLRAGEWQVAEAIRSLTVREQEVLALVADGRTNRDIGLALFIEPRTVEKHVEHIRTKLGARSRTEAAAKWARGVGVPSGI